MITIYKGRERPGVDLFWLDTTKTPVDFTAGGNWTWTVSLEQDTVETTLSGVTVTTNADPTIDSGLPTDVASLTLSFAAGSLDNVSVGPGLLRVIGISSGLDRELVVPVRIAR